MYIRRAKEQDIDALTRLLSQVLEVHHRARPDLFKTNVTKYTTEELCELICDDTRPIFVATDGDEIVGYVFCVFVQHKDNNILTDIKTLYIDDLCVEQSRRGEHIGKALYEYALNFAKESDCYNLTLNVWSGNESAMRFYEKCGLKPQKVGMEIILD